MTGKERRARLVSKRASNLEESFQVVYRQVCLEIFLVNAQTPFLEGRDDCGHKWCFHQGRNLMSSLSMSFETSWLRQESWMICKLQ